ncbi:MAG: phosphoribosylformylglycinamidine cyclo-ligase [Pirellulaceae bacterium]|nr:MAG: phosphoribosylformylglycinamidine cyclo-ligase [Pirellulaceae bacterium]
MAKITYKDAGVDLDRYADAMARLPRWMHRTYSPRVIPLDGGFAGLFRLDFRNNLFARRYEEPVLVACTDGVGTKIKIAQMAQRHETIGIDLVAMCVNDALCAGAEPLFFLDYVAMAEDNPPLLEKIIQGISEGCIQADCALLGGETAIMPDLYAPGVYDLAGFCVGVVEQRRMITGATISPNDVVLGLASSGLHSNGFSLVRKLVFQVARLSLEQSIEELQGRPLVEVLLEPTRIYVPAVRRVLRYYRVKNVVHGMAHITGGGLRENLARVVPKTCDVVLDPDSWPVPPVFSWLQKLGELDDAEMERVFNMGIGFVLVVSPHYADNIDRMLTEAGERVYRIGRAVPGNGNVLWQ